MANLVSNIDGILQIFDDGTVNIVGGSLHIDNTEVLNNNNNALFSNVRVNTLDFGDASPTLSDDSDYLKIQTTHGYTSIGAGNSSYSHFYTDRASFYFNKKIVLDSGQLRSYDEDLNLNRAGSTTARLRLTSGTTISDQDFSVTGDVNISGDLTVSGTTVTLNTTTITAEDAVILLNSGQSTPANDIGLVFQRYSSATSANYNPVILWEEANDKFVLGSTTEAAADADISLNTQWLVVTSSGNVGIGSNTPTDALVVSNGTVPTVYVGDKVSTSKHANLIINRGSSSYDANLMFKTGDSTKWRIWLDGIDNTLQVRDEANSSNIMTWETGGNVGINIDDPNAILHIKDGTNPGNSQWDYRVTANFQARNGNTSHLELTQIRDAGGVNNWQYTGTRLQQRIDSTYMGYMQFNGYSNDYGISWGTGGGTAGPEATPEKMRLKSNGNLGIGTTNPSEKLHVDGNIKSTGTITASEIRPTYIHSQNYGVDNEILFEITDWDDSASIRMKFGTSSSNFTKVDDADAPASGVFDVTNYTNLVWGPYIPMGDDTEIIFECWVKHESGTDSTGNFYAGSQFYDGNKSSFGNVNRYWGANGDPQDSDNTTWRHIKGVLNASVIRADSGTADAEYFRHLTLFNYNTTGNTTRFCGFRFYKSNKTISSLYAKTHNGNLNNDSAFQSSEAGTVFKIVDLDANVHAKTEMTVDSNTVWHAGNDGSGSGLDADLLDGLQSGSYLRSDADDTMNARLAIKTGSHYTVGGNHELSLLNSMAIGPNNGNLVYFRYQGSAGNFAMQTYNNANTGELHLQPYGGKVGIQNTSPNFPLHINKGTGSYSPTSGVNENVFGVNSTYDAAGSQHVTFSRLDGNWLDGTTGADSAFGWLWNYQNSVRGGMMYDHRSTEQFQIFSSYAPIVFYTTDAADGNAVPTDSNMNQRMTIMPGGKVGIGTTNPVNAKVHIIGDGSYVGNYGYNTLTLEDTSGYPGLNLRSGNNNWLIRKDGNNNSLQIVNSTDASGPSTGTYNNRFTILSNGRVGIGTNSPDASLHVVGQGSFEHEGNRNRGNLILGPHGSGTDKWSTLAGTHYNDASGSGNGSGAAGIMLIGSSSSSTTNKIFIGHGPYELNPATEIRLGTHTATTHSTGGTTHFVIDSDGKTIVGASSAQGIGTSSKLQVRGGAIDITDSDSGRSIRFYQNTTFRGGIGPGNWTGEGSNSSLGMYATGGDISFHHNSGTPTVRISDEGHLGLERSDASSGVTKGYPKIVYPNVHWSNSGNSTGQVRIRLPGNLNNYDMLHMELTVYEYNSTNATTIIVGGHNWNSGGAGGSTNALWHNFGVKVIGTFTKPIYLTGDANDRYIVLGDVGSTWTYGMVSLARVHGATFYSTAFDLAGDWNIEKVTSSSYTWSSSNLNTNTSDTLSTRGNMVTSGFKLGRGNVSNNFKVKTATTGAAGITLYNSDDTWRAQIYGDGTNYGFLNANWAAWDIKKVIGGKMFFNANDSYYLQPESISVLDELIVEGRRVNQSSNGLSMATGTWYTIATNAGNRASAKFHIRDTASSRHQSVHFYASHMYGNNSAITILHNCAYSTSPYRYIRIKEGGTYDGALLQVYTDNTASYVGYIYENDQSAGWNLLGTPVPDGTDPGTVSNFAALTNVPVQLDIDTTAYGGIATSGPIWSKYDVTAYSDRRVKTNIEVIPDALEKVKKLSGYTFNRTDTKHEVKQTGVIAQEVMEVLPEAVNGDDEGGYSVAYGNMVGMLIEAIKDQQTQIDELKDMVRKLTEK